MLKLAIVGLAGVTVAALLLFQSTSRSSFPSGSSSSSTSSLFPLQKTLGDSQSSQITLINDIKEIFGLPPIPTSSLGGKSSGAGSLSSSAGYLPPRAASRDGAAAGVGAAGAQESTTPFFRIILTSSTTAPTTTKSSSSSTTGRPETLTSATPATESSTIAPITPSDNSSLSESTTLLIDTRIGVDPEHVTTNSIVVDAIPPPATTLHPPTKPSRPDDSLNDISNKSVNGTKVHPPPSREYLPPHN